MTFLSILPFFRANLAVSKKRIILEGWSLDKVYKKHVTFFSQMSFFKAHWTHCRNWLVTNDSVWFRNGCSPVNLLHIFRTPFRSNTSGRLLQ